MSIKNKIENFKNIVANNKKMCYTAKEMPKWWNGRRDGLKIRCW